MRPRHEEHYVECRMKNLHGAHPCRPAFEGEHVERGAASCGKADSGKLKNSER